MKDYEPVENKYISVSHTVSHTVVSWEKGTKEDKKEYRCLGRIVSKDRDRINFEVLYSTCLTGRTGRICWTSAGCKGDVVKYLTEEEAIPLIMKNKLTGRKEL